MKDTDFSRTMLKVSRERSTQHGQAIEAMIRAYMEDSGALIGEIELVETRNGFETSYSIRKIRRQ